jgi:hypothetical protein
MPMPFSDSTKVEAKRRAHFSCVICHRPFVEVHHIIPQASGGGDELDNAAALCAYCHDLFGANPDKRKQIREMRDLWYELCETRFRGFSELTLAKEIEEMRRRQQEQGAMISEMKALFERYYSQRGNAMAAASTATDVASLSGVSIPQPSRLRWINSTWRYEQLKDKRVFAHFVTNSGHQYTGTGKLRVGQNPAGLLKIDLVFTRQDTPYQMTDIIFHLSSRQARNLREVPNGTEDYEFRYEGILTPDIEPD